MYMNTSIKVVGWYVCCKSKMVVKLVCSSERGLLREGGLVLLSGLLIYEPGKEIFHLLPFISFIHPLPLPFTASIESSLVSVSHTLP